MTADRRRPAESDTYPQATTTVFRQPGRSRDRDLGRRAVALHAGLFWPCLVSAASPSAIPPGSCRPCARPCSATIRPRNMTRDPVGDLHDSSMLGREGDRRAGVHAWRYLAVMNSMLPTSRAARWLIPGRAASAPVELAEPRSTFCWFLPPDSVAVATCGTMARGCRIAHLLVGRLQDGGRPRGANHARTGAGVARQNQVVVQRKARSIRTAAVARNVSRLRLVMAQLPSELRTFLTSHRRGWTFPSEHGAMVRRILTSEPSTSLSFLIRLAARCEEFSVPRLRLVVRRPPWDDSASDAGRLPIDSVKTDRPSSLSPP